MMAAARKENESQFAVLRCWDVSDHEHGRFSRSDCADFAKFVREIYGLQLKYQHRPNEDTDLLFVDWSSHHGTQVSK